MTRLRLKSPRRTWLRRGAAAALALPVIHLAQLMALTLRNFHGVWVVAVVSLVATSVIVVAAFCREIERFDPSGAESVMKPVGTMFRLTFIAHLAASVSFIVVIGVLLYLAAMPDFEGLALLAFVCLLTLPATLGTAIMMGWLFRWVALEPIPDP